MKVPFGLVILLLVFVRSAGAAGDPRPISLWPDRAPGETASLPPEADTTKPGDELIAGRRVIRLGNVSTPTMTIYRPDPARNTGAAMLVCPGGGYFILSMDLEGTEACEWLNSVGVTAVLLKYRVPRRAGLSPYTAPLQDAQRSLGLVRSQAKVLGIDPDRIGVLGFSAGGHLAAALSNNHGVRSYAAVDAADQASCRPDFCVLVYPAYLNAMDRDGGLAPELSVSATNTPPTFIAQAQDDVGYIDAGLAYYLALKNAKVPAELHLYPNGGHGYGLRRTAVTVTTWPDRVTDWMRASGWLNAAK